MPLSEGDALGRNFIKLQLWRKSYLPCFIANVDECGPSDRFTVRKSLFTRLR